MNETLLIISMLLSAAQTIASDAAKAQRENRDPTPEEDARRAAARQFAETQWASLAPREP